MSIHQQTAHLMTFKIATSTLAVQRLSHTGPRRREHTLRRNMRSIILAVVLIITACAAPAPESPASTPTESAVSSAPADELSRDEALDVAREALQAMGEEWEVERAQAGPLGRVRPGWEELQGGHDLSADLKVWRVVLSSGSLGAEVLIGLGDGEVYSSVGGIAN